MSSSTAVTIFTAGLLVLTTGCLGIDNMHDLKETLGANTYTPPTPDPQPPVALIAASATTALVDETVQFSAESSHDPLNLALTYTWNFGDGTTSNDPRATHAWATEGSYVVTLTATNTAGLTTNATHAIRVTRTNLAPTASIQIADATGAPTNSVDVNALLTFTANATDPEGSNLTHHWILGDGTTSTDRETRHAYTTPGRYQIILTVTDDHGQATRVSRNVSINSNWTATGKVSPATPYWERAFTTNLPHELNLTITYEPVSGTESLRITLKDAASRTIANATATSTLGNGNLVTRSITIPQDIIAQHGKGDWTVIVERDNGAIETTFDVLVMQRY